MRGFCYELYKEPSDLTKEKQEFERLEAKLTGWNFTMIDLTRYIELKKQLEM